MIWRRQIPLLITFVTAAVMTLQYYFANLNWISNFLVEWFAAISAFAYVLGGASLFMVNGRKIQKQAPGWFYNLTLLVSLVVTLYFGLFKHYPGHRPTEPGTAFYWIFDYVYDPLSATMYSLLAFFIASASFRAFRAKSVESTLLLLSAFIIMILRVPLGEWLWAQLPFFSQIEVSVIIEEYMMSGFNIAGQRAIQLAAAIGLISMSFKIMLGIERSYLGGD